MNIPEIDIFLKALEVRLNLSGTFLAVQTVESTRFNAYKYYKIEVWLLDGANRECISSTKQAAQHADREAVQRTKNEIIQTTIESILEHYGL